MQTLVAGGAGFLGSHLCERLLEDGQEVICLDNLVTGRSSNIAHLLPEPRFQFIEADIVDELPLMPRLDRIYHLASPASPPVYCRYPVETLRANAEGTRRLLERASEDGSRFLYVSSSEIYGDPLEHPQHEGYRGNVNPIGPRSMYDEGKRYGEAITAAYGGAGRLSGRIVRLFNTYGPRSDPQDGRMIPNFVTQALRNEPITIHGDGRQTRAVCYVADIIDGLLRTMESMCVAGEAVNLGNPEERTVLEYAKFIREAVGSRSPLMFVEHAVGDDPRRRRPDIRKAQELLGWQPSFSLEEGLALTVAYFRETLSEM